MNVNGGNIAMYKGKEFKALSPKDEIMILVADCVENTLEGFQKFRSDWFEKEVPLSSLDSVYFISYWGQYKNELSVVIKGERDKIYYVQSFNEGMANKHNFDRYDKFIYEKYVSLSSMGIVYEIKAPEYDFKLPFKTGIYIVYHGKEYKVKDEHLTILQKPNNSDLSIMLEKKESEETELTERNMFLDEIESAYSIFYSGLYKDLEIDIKSDVNGQCEVSHHVYHDLSTRFGFTKVNDSLYKRVGSEDKIRSQIKMHGHFCFKANIHELGEDEYEEIHQVDSKRAEELGFEKINPGCYRKVVSYDDLESVRQVKLPIWGFDLP